MSTYSKIADGLRLIGITGCTNDIVNSWLKGLGMSGTTPDMLFSYLRSIGLTGSLSDMLSAYIFSATEEKVLIDLSPTSNGFYSLGADYVATDSYTIKANIETSTQQQGMIVANSAGSDSFLAVLGDIFRLRIDGSSFSTPSVNYYDGKLHAVRVEVTAATVKFYFDNTLISSQTKAQNQTITIDIIGRYSNNDYFFGGIISDVELISITTPANSLEFKLNQLTGNTETNNGVTLTYQNIGTGTDVRDTYTRIDDDYIGSEVWDNNNLDGLSGDWSSAVEGVFELNGSAGSLLRPLGAQITYDAITTFDYVAGSGAGLRLGSTGIEEFITSGSYSVEGADASALGFKRWYGTVVGTVSNVSIKRKIEVA
tara:strand:- start:66 stop:1172 length:1107 start_codon:yes stop_codon:yes gene_type:complete